MARFQNPQATFYQYQHALLANHGEPPPATINLRNLAFPLPIGTSPWGPSHKPDESFCQPILLSVRIALYESFSTASASDTVDDSTVHYGVLSKSILRIVKDLQSQKTGRWSIGDFVNWLAEALTGEELERPYDYYRPKILDLGSSRLLKCSNMRELEFEVELPKGSLKSSAIRFKRTFGYSIGLISSVLSVEGLRIPTLIGVNANERTATQIVVANIEIDPYEVYENDLYPQLEDVVFRTIEESSFETLESLAEHVWSRILTLFLQTHVPLPGTEKHDVNVRIRLEKPSAVTFADAPVIEIIRTWDGNGGDLPGRPPFPLPPGMSLRNWVMNNRSNIE